ncbi:polysaccharide pyruvyl transferase family protein [Photorhabdus sp. RM71S]|uniref:polysaccharide pyruvyl transferase family protein n=1 Tax=Photorhabdus sp. RM71S TaxID=3342824 RepID=UPI0036DE79B1
MKKIGILTQPLINNYGGILQCIALYNYLTEKGYEVTIIQKHLYNPLWKKIIIKALELIPNQNYRGFRNRAKQYKTHKIFIDHYIPNKTKIIYTHNSLIKIAKNYQFDVVIVGSDQVWRMAYINDPFYAAYFLNFVDSISCKKIAYAASFGKNHWETPEKISEISHLLADFTAISVRESSGVKICNDIFNYTSATHVLDPTLLINPKFYQQFIAKRQEKNNVKKLLTYVLDESENKKVIIKNIKKSLGENISTQHLLGFNKHEIITIPEWLTAFYNADFIITDSFHGMVFSIIFNKQFLVIGNNERGMERFVSLLSLLKLKDRLIISGEISNNFNMNKREKINYSLVNKIVSENRKNSEKFLNSINDDTGI